MWYFVSHILHNVLFGSIAVSEYSYSARNNRIFPPLLYSTEQELVHAKWSGRIFLNSLCTQGVAVGSIHAVHLQLQGVHRNPFFFLSFSPRASRRRPFNDIPPNFTRSFTCFASLVHKLRTCYIFFPLPLFFSRLVHRICLFLLAATLWSALRYVGAPANPTYQYWSCVWIMQSPAFPWSLHQVILFPPSAFVFSLFSISFRVALDPPHIFFARRRR